MNATGGRTPDRSGRPGPPEQRHFLFLQGPNSPFFARLADALEARGHRIVRINLSVGDWLFWRRPGAVNYRGRRSAWPRYVGRFMDEAGITDLMLLGDRRAHHAAAIEAAHARGIAVTVTEPGYLRPDWITLERDGTSAGSRFPRDPEQIRALARQVPEPDLTPRFADAFWTVARANMLYNLSTSLLWFLFPHYRRHQRTHPVLNYAGTALRLLTRRARDRDAVRAFERVRASGAAYYVMPLQWPDDFSIRAHSPYVDLHEPLREVIASFARAAPPPSRLLIKVHPFDPGLVAWRRVAARFAAAAGIADRVAYFDGGPLPPLLDGTRGVVTINSTAGLAALRAGRPVVTLGRALWDIEGLTFAGPLDRFWTEARPPDPALVAAFVRALAGTVQIRGVHSGGPGLEAAVAEAADRLDRGLVNAPIVRDGRGPRRGLLRRA